MTKTQSSIKDHSDSVRKIIAETKKPVGIEDVIQMQKNYENLMQRYNHILNIPRHKKIQTTADTFL